MENTDGNNLSSGNDQGKNDDQKRIDALESYQILNTPREATFDNVAKVVAKIFEVSICLISFVDTDTVYFKAMVGLTNIKPTPRTMSLCSMVVLNGGVLVFEDAQVTSCILANAVVAGEYGLRFYAGAPLTTKDGLRIGSICILHETPRAFSKQEEILLQGFGDIVMDAVEMRVSLIKEKQRQEQIIEIVLKNTYKDFLLNPNAVSSLCVLKGRDFIVESLSNTLINDTGRYKDIIGKPLFMALPELLEEDQPFYDLLTQVYDTGMPVYRHRVRVLIDIIGERQEAYVDFVYHPLKNDMNVTDGIIILTTKATDQTGDSRIGRLN